MAAFKKSPDDSPIEKYEDEAEASAHVRYIATVCWIPTEIYYLVTTFGLTLIVPRIFNLVDTLAMSNSIVNPWIYYFTNKEYKKAFKRLFNDIVFPVQVIVKCCRSNSLTVINVESPEANSG